MKHYVIVISVLVWLTGCSEPLPENRRVYAGLWQNSQTSLLITNEGQLEYQTSQGSMTKTITAPIKSISPSKIEAGFLFISSEFALRGPPKEEEGMMVLVVDGERLFKAKNPGEFPPTNDVPSIHEMRSLVSSDLRRLSSGINSGDFSGYLNHASMVFQSEFNNDDLREAYKSFSEQEINVENWMIGDFILVSEPLIDAEGILRVEGKYPNTPSSL